MPCFLWLHETRSNLGISSVSESEGSIINIEELAAGYLSTMIGDEEIDRLNLQILLTEIQSGTIKEMRELISTK